MYTVIELKLKIAELINKWKDNKPIKLTDKWWRYRADQILYREYKRRLDSLTRENKL